MGNDGNQGSAPGTEFLHLEIQEVLKTDAQKATGAAFSELLKEAAKAQLKERWGDKIEGLAAIAVDQLVSELEANLRIGEHIQGQNTQRQQTRSKLAELFSGDGD